jgi:hypothetical protein
MYVFSMEDFGVSNQYETECKEWERLALTEIFRLAKSGIVFTADDVRERVSDPPNPNLMGKLFRSTSRMGKIVSVGYSRSLRRLRHGAVVQNWVGA